MKKQRGRLKVKRNQHGKRKFNKKENSDKYEHLRYKFIKYSENESMKTSFSFIKVI